MQTRVQRILLEVAREAVTASASGHALTKLSPEYDGIPDLIEPRGAFVSLHDRVGELRGCIGTTVARDPLLQVVVEMAQAAASRDPRFPPVRPEEVDDLELEVSVLYPLERIHDLSEVVIGEHGLVAEGKGRRGLLLPQVATERSWDAETFARHTCLKAGLPVDAYLGDEVKMYRFRSEVFSEQGD